uniref:Ankyrin repeat domain-containing protein n=1 Tax=Oryza sativa subsp. japonica TaxID=39947 RepID=Q6UUE6_ORYSJ|nr:hypothetical protein OSJNBa0038J12.18 [Oryza sativa Japonica Group]AAQ56418.1 hypothetical protein OSJNBa0024A05.4 [Oryza sativa Japonica Group]
MRALRVDTTLAGFDGLRIRRADHLFLFFGEEADTGGRHLPPGSLLVLHRGKSASGSGSHGPTANAGLSGAAAAAVLDVVRGGSARELPPASPSLSFCSRREREWEIETIKRGKETE